MHWQIMGHDMPISCSDFLFSFLVMIPAFFFLISFTQKPEQAVMKPGLAVSFTKLRWCFHQVQRAKRLASTNYQLHSCLSWFAVISAVRHEIRCLNSNLRSTFCLLIKHRMESDFQNILFPMEALKRNSQILSGSWILPSHEQLLKKTGPKDQLQAKCDCFGSQVPISKRWILSRMTKQPTRT